MIFGTALLVLILLILLVNFFFKSSKEDSRGWKFRKDGTNELRYFEIISNDWESITFRLEWYANDAPRHVIYVPKDWSEYPIWAQEHKLIILNRLNQEYKAPQYTIREIE